MKYLSLICAGLLLLATLNMPYQYYTILKIVVTIGAVAMVFNDYKNRVNFLWILIFLGIAVLFNPIMPIDLGSKENELFVNIVVGFLFFIRTVSIRDKIKTYTT